MSKEMPIGLPDALAARMTTTRLRKRTAWLWLAAWQQQQWRSSMREMEDADKQTLAALVARYGEQAVRAALAPDAVAAVKTLARRELETLRLVAAGHTIKTAARVMGISPNTADHNMKEAREKLGITSRAQAAALVVRAGVA